VRKVLRRHHRREPGSTQNAWVLAVFALGCGLFLWILSVFTIVSYEFARFRQFWSTPGSMGLSNFELAALVGILFTFVTLLSAATAWRSSEARPWGLLATYAASLSVVVAWGVNFYGMATIPSMTSGTSKPSAMSRTTFTGSTWPGGLDPAVP